MNWINPKKELPTSICSTVVLIRCYNTYITRFAIYFPEIKYFQIENAPISNRIESNIDDILGYIVLPKIPNNE